MKNLRLQNKPIDAIDAKILRALFEDARMTMAELSRRLNLSPPSVLERVRKLEEAQIIEGYSAQLNPLRLGLPLAAYIRIRPMPGQLRKIVEVLRELEAVVECDRVTGEDCFIAKVQVGSVGELEKVLDKIVPYAMTNTSIIQSSPVKRRLLPLAMEA